MLKSDAVNYVDEHESLFINKTEESLVYPKCRSNLTDPPLGVHTQWPTSMHHRQSKSHPERENTDLIQTKP